MKKYTILFVMLLIIPLAVYAATDGAIIKMTLQSNGEFKTASYNFTGSKYFVAYDVTEIKNSAYAQKVVVQLVKDGLFTDKAYAALVEPATYRTRTCVDMGNYSSGKHFYKFGAYSTAFGVSSGTRVPYAGMYSETVNMYSV